MAPFAQSKATREERAPTVPILPDWAVQLLQVVTILALGPLLSGLIARAEANIA